MTISCKPDPAFQYATGEVLPEGKTYDEMALGYSDKGRTAYRFGIRRNVYSSRNSGCFILGEAKPERDRLWIALHRKPTPASMILPISGTRRAEPSASGSEIWMSPDGCIASLRQKTRGIPWRS